MTETPPDPDELTYEQARDELIAIVAKLEAGTPTLDESLGLWERGEALASRCQDLLDGARGRITDARGTDPDDAGVVAVATDLGGDEDEDDDSSGSGERA
ncbi:MAG: exodeoxyribonuclease VII small subunit [Demequina sp.]